MLTAMVAVFAGFWSQQRLVLRRIHGLAAIDPEFGSAVEARNRRRHGIAARVVERLCAGRPEIEEEERARRIACLVAMTSFEFFDALVESSGDVAVAEGCLYPLVRKAIAPGE